MKNLKLTPSTRALLTRLRKSGMNLSVYDLDPDVTGQALTEICRPFIERAGLRQSALGQFRCFLRELGKLLRTEQGWDLAFELESLLRKWTGYGLDPALLQRLLGESCGRLAIPESAREDYDASSKAPETR